MKRRLEVPFPPDVCLEPTDRLMRSVSRRALILSRWLAVGAVVGLTAAPARAADDAVTPGTGNTTIEDADTWDIDAAQGAVDANITFNDADSNSSLTVTSGAGTSSAAQIGTLTVQSSTGFTQELVVGANGNNNPVELTVNGAISGNVANDSSDLKMTLDARSANQTILFLGDVDLGTGRIELNDGNSSIATLQFNGVDQSVTGIITTVDKGLTTTGEGRVVVGDGTNPASVTFNSRIGDWSNTESVARFIVNSGAQATIKSNIDIGEIITSLAAVPDAGIKVDGTLTLDSSERAVMARSIGRSIDLNGTVNVTGSNEVVIVGAPFSVFTVPAIAIDGTMTTALTGGSVLRLECLNQAEGFTGCGDRTIAIGGNSNTTVNIGNPIVVSGGVNPLGTNRVDGGVLALGGNGTTTNLVINRSAHFDPTKTAVIDATAATVIVNESGTINVSLGSNTGPVYVNGDTITVIDGSSQVQGSTSGPTTYTALIANGVIVLQDTGTLDFTHDTTSNVEQDLVAKFSIKEDLPPSVTSALQATSTSAFSCHSDASAIAASSASNGDALAFSALACTSETEVDNVAEQLSPDPNGSGTVALTSVATRTNTVIGFRLASLRDDILYAERGPIGLAAGDDYGSLTQAIWAKPYSSYALQGDRGGVAGFNAFTWGLLGGVDTELFPEQIDGARAGLSIGYADTQVHGNGSGDNFSQIDSYQVALYGDYTTGDFFLEGILAFSWNTIETSRQLTFGGLDRVAEGNYDARQYAARIDAGLPVDVGGGHFLTPTVGFQYIQVESDDYTETGAGNLNLNVDQDTLHQAIGLVGVRYHTDLDLFGGSLRPELRGMVTYDFASDEALSTSTFTGGGASFETTGVDVAELGGAVGFGVGYTSDDAAWTVSADYEAAFRNDYRSHTGMAQVTLRY